MAGYIGSKASVTQVDGYNRTEADSEFVQVTGDTMTGNLITSGNVTANQFTGGGTIITSGQLSDSDSYSTTSTNYQTASRFQITPTTSTSKLLGWFFCQMRATSGTNITDGDMGNTARAHHLNSSGSWSAIGSLVQNLRTENSNSTGYQEIAVTFPIILNQSDLSPSGVWDVAIRHYEVFDAQSAIDDGRLFYMEFEP